MEKYMFSNKAESPPTWNQTDRANATLANAVKKVRWHVQNPTAVVEKWTITPIVAEAMLEWNDRNRPISSSQVELYADWIKRGQWHFTGEPVIFSTVRLLDGQHRLNAVIKAGHSIEALVVFGSPDESFAHINVGKTRTASDIFAINGVQNYAMMAAATTIIYGLDALDSPNAAVKSGGGKITKAELYDFYCTLTGLDRSVPIGHIFTQAKLVPPSVMCGLHYLCAKKSRKEADEFFTKVGSGIGFNGKKDPACRLRDKFIDNLRGSDRMGRKTMMAITIKAWNAARAGREATKMFFGADETFPKIR